MATPKSPTSTEKKPSTRKAPAKSTAKVDAAPVAENSIDHNLKSNIARRIPNYEDVARLAEQYWNDRGRPYGSPEVDWLRAEATLLAA